MKKLYYDLKKCTGCKTCGVVCAVGHSPSKDLYTAILEENLALPCVRVHFVAGKNYLVTCRHCKDYPCVNACIASALSYTSEKGLSFDREKCVGCWMCIMVCPYGAVRSDKRYAKPEGNGAAPASRSHKSVRCDLCADIQDPRCAKSCPTKAIIYREEKK